MPDLIGVCPACQHGLVVRELECPHCGLTLRAHFNLPVLGQLTPEMGEFLRLFVISRGNLREMERMLGVSYPTVRSKLDQLVSAFAAGETDRAAASSSTGDWSGLSQHVAEVTRHITQDVMSKVFGGDSAPTPPTPGRLDKDAILAKVAAQELSVDEALRLLQAIGEPGDPS